MGHTTEHFYVEDKLIFERNLISFETGVQTLARPAKVFSYVSKDDHGMAEPTPDKPSGLDELGHKAFRASMELFREPALQYAHSRVHHMKEMELYVKKKQEAETAESHYVECSTKGVWLSVGSVVKLSCSFGKRIGSVANASMGEFLVIDVTHDVGDDRFYGNSFRAIPSVARSLPVRDVGRSVAETQVARVIGNADPDGKGRVQVQMNWQTGNMRTGWIRVMTPDGGGSENVSTNRGFVFIPEVGDHVLVGFRHGDPNRPYVMGSLFNGRTGVGGFAENHLKSIRTRSGHVIELDDAPSSLGITIKDNKGNSVHIDSAEDSIVVNAEKDITFNAAETFTVNCKNANILAQESININAEENISSLSGEDTTIQAGRSLIETASDSYILSTSDANVQVSNSHNVQAATISETAEKVNLDSTIEDMDLSSPKKVNIKSSDKINLF